MITPPESIVKAALSFILAIALCFGTTNSEAKTHRHHRHTGITTTHQTVDIYVYGMMTLDYQLLHNIYIINSMHAGDTLIMHIDSGGGLVVTVDWYVQAIHKKHLHWIASVDNGALAASAAGVLSMDADEVYYAPTAVFMAHMVFFYDPMGNKVVEPSESRYLLSKCCHAVITPDEMVMILEDGQLWLKGKYVILRLKAAHAKQYSNNKYSLGN